MSLEALHKGLRLVRVTIVHNVFENSRFCFAVSSGTRSFDGGGSRKSTGSTTAGRTCWIILWLWLWSVASAATMTGSNADWPRFAMLYRAKYNNGSTKGLRRDASEWQAAGTLTNTGRLASLRNSSQAPQLLCSVLGQCSWWEHRTPK